MRALSKVMAGVVTLAMAGGIVASTTGIANAAYNPSAPPYPADANNVASLTIFDSTTGAVVTSGTTSTTLDKYYFVSSANFGTADAGAGRKAALFGYVAEAGKAPGAFNGGSLGGGTTFPATTAPAPVNGFATPTALGDSASTFGSFASAFPNPSASTTDFYQLYQLRVKTTFPAPSSTKYAYADIKIDPSAGTWTQLAPTTDTSPRPPVAPGKPTATAGDTTATVTVPTVPGATSYTVTSSPASTPVTGAGPTFSFTGLTNGTAYTFTATATNANGTSPSSVASDPVTPRPAPVATTTTVSLSAGPYDTTTMVTVSSHVAAGANPATAGSVAFTDNLDGALGSGTVNATGDVVLPARTFSATGGTQHVVTATFTDGSATFAGSSGASQPFSVAYGAGNPCAAPLGQCTETQYFQATVAAGSLVISTPYTSTSPFDLGTLALNDSGTLLSISKPFGSATIPAAAAQPKSTDPVSAYAPNYSGVTIVDRRAGQLGWTANLNSSDFTSGTNKIDGRNLGFTGVNPAYIVGNGLQAISTFQNTAANGVAPGGTLAAGQPVGVKGTTKFASAPVGASVGTVYVYGLMTLNAPTSTAAGLYAATVTFTIV